MAAALLQRHVCKLSVRGGSCKKSDSRPTHGNQSYAYHFLIREKKVEKEGRRELEIVDEG